MQHPILQQQEAQLLRGTMRHAMSVKTVVNVAQMLVELHLTSPPLGE